MGDKAPKDKAKKKKKAEEKKKPTAKAAGPASKATKK
jgi:hypothetical protein